MASSDKKKTEVRSSYKVLKDPGVVRAADIEEFLIDGKTQQEDLMYLKSILVSSGANKNDDVFLTSELVASKDTPENKPVNWRHDGDHVIGHMYKSVLTDKTEVPISEADVITLQDTDLVDILSYAVVYKMYFGDEAEQIKNAETTGDLAVSMECFFKKFDYLVGNKVVKRVPETSFLDLALRANGGPGEFNNEKIRRVLRDIIFGAIGIVENPANPDSKIKAVAFECDSDHETAILQNVMAEIKIPNLSEVGVENSDREDKMKFEFENGILEIFSADKAEEFRTWILEGCEISAKNGVKEVKTVDEETKAKLEKFDDLEKSYTDLKDEFDKYKEETEGRMNELSDSVAEKDEKIGEADKRYEELEKEKSDLSDKLSAIEAEKVAAERIAQLKEIVEVTSENEEKYLEKARIKTEEQWEEFMETIGDFAIKTETEEPETTPEETSSEGTTEEEETPTSAEADETEDSDEKTAEALEVLSELKTEGVDISGIGPTDVQTPEEDLDAKARRLGEALVFKGKKNPNSEE